MWNNFLYILCLDFLSITCFLSLFLFLGELYLKPIGSSFFLVVLIACTILPSFLLYTIPVGFFFSIMHHVYKLVTSDRIFLFKALPLLSKQWKRFIGIYTILIFLLYIITVGWLAPMLMSKTSAYLEKTDSFFKYAPSEEMIYLDSGVSFFFESKLKEEMRKLFFSLDLLDKTSLFFLANRGLVTKRQIKVIDVEGLVHNKEKSLALHFVVKELSVKYINNKLTLKSKHKSLYELLSSVKQSDQRERNRRLLGFVFFFLSSFFAWRAGFYAAQGRQGFLLLLLFSFIFLLLLYFFLNVM